VSPGLAAYDHGRDIFGLAEEQARGALLDAVGVSRGLEKVDFPAGRCHIAEPGVERNAPQEAQGRVIFDISMYNTELRDRDGVEVLPIDRF